MKTLGYFLDQVAANHPQEVSNKQEIILRSSSMMFLLLTTNSEFVPLKVCSIWALIFYCSPACGRFTLYLRQKAMVNTDNRVGESRQEPARHIKFSSVLHSLSSPQPNWNWKSAYSETTSKPVFEAWQHCGQKWSVHRNSAVRNSFPHRKCFVILQDENSSKPQNYIAHRLHTLPRLGTQRECGAFLSTSERKKNWAFFYVLWSSVSNCTWLIMSSHVTL